MKKIEKSNLECRKAFLGELSYYRNAPICHYTEVIDLIEPRILPLVQAFDSHMTTPIYSCEGHWHKKKAPSVTFAVLPGQNHHFYGFVTALLENTPKELVFFSFFHRHRPKRFPGGPGPFVDWKLVMDVPFPGLKAENDFTSFQETVIPKYAEFFENKLNNWNN